MKRNIKNKLASFLSIFLIIGMLTGNVACNKTEIDFSEKEEEKQEDLLKKSLPTFPIKEKYVISFLGDSITFGHGVSISQRYTTLLQSQSYLKTVNNYGISGTTIGKSGLPQYQNNTFNQRYSQIDNNSDIIFVFGGTNDYGSTPNQAVTLGESTDATVDTFYGAVENLIVGIENGFPNAVIIFITPLQRDNDKWGYPKNTLFSQYGYVLQDYRDAIIDKCEEHSLYYLDFYNLEGMRKSDSTFSQYYVDGLHPNATGHAMLANQIDKFLKEKLSVV